MRFFRSFVVRYVICGTLLVACGEPTAASDQKIGDSAVDSKGDASTREPKGDSSVCEKTCDASVAQETSDASAAGGQKVDASIGDQEIDGSVEGEESDAGDCRPPRSTVQTGNAYGEVSAIESSGLWIFTYDEQSGDEALLSGKAGMRCGCLVVNDAVVIWDETWLDYVNDIASRVRAGEAPEVTGGGGGGVSLVPAVVFEHCGVDGVVYQNTD